MTQQVKAVMACAEWLKCCLSIGWHKSDLDDLQRIWWQWHDDDGNLIPRKEDADAEIAGDKR